MQADFRVSVGASPIEFSYSRDRRVIWQVCRTPCYANQPYCSVIRVCDEGQSGNAVTIVFYVAVSKRGNKEGELRGSPLVSAATIRLEDKLQSELQLAHGGSE